jgi:hypothetical protein
MMGVEISKLDDREKRGYEEKPDTLDDWEVWEREASWPDPPPTSALRMTD